VALKSSLSGCGGPEEQDTNLLGCGGTERQDYQPPYLCGGTDEQV